MAIRRLNHLRRKKRLCGARLGKSEWRSNFDKIQASRQVVPANAVRANGELVTHNGEIVTHTP